MSPIFTSMGVGISIISYSGRHENSQQFNERLLYGVKISIWFSWRECHCNMINIFWWPELDFIKQDKTTAYTFRQTIVLLADRLLDHIISDRNSNHKSNDFEIFKILLLGCWSDKGVDVDGVTNVIFHKKRVSFFNLKKGKCR